MPLNLKSIFQFEKLENIIFEIGIFFLVIAPSISAIFLTISAVTGSLGRRDSYLKDKWNYPFLVASFLIIINCLNIYHLDDSLPIEVDRESSILSAINWLPFFYIFWAFKKFLKTDTQRKRCANLLVFGSLPFLIGGFLQVIFNVYGPFNLFNGFILWFQREGKTFTSAFNNPNYAATWLSLILPFCFAGIISIHKFNFKKIIFLLISALSILATILTYSRNGFLAILITFAVFFNIFAKISMLIPTIFVVVTSILLILFFSEDLEAFLPEDIFNKFNFSKIKKLNEIVRLKIFRDSFNLISLKPIFGWGATTFPIIYKFYYPQSSGFQHTHNIFIEVTYNYGVFVSLLIFGTIFLLIFKSNIEKKSLQRNYEKAWKLSTIIFLIISQFDFTYYDIRISTLFWILITGISCFNKEKNMYEKLVD